MCRSLGQHQRRVAFVEQQGCVGHGQSCFRAVLLQQLISAQFAVLRESAHQSCIVGIGIQAWANQIDGALELLLAAV